MNFRRLSLLLVALVLLVAGMSLAAIKVWAVNANPAVGSIWTWLGPTSGADWVAPAVATGGLTPQAYGCVGDGTTDDTTCLQAAINGATSLGVPLYFPSNKLYKITNTINLADPVSLQGPPFRYGIWPVNQPTNTGAKKCPWGIVNYNTGIIMINASAVTGTIHGLCIDATGNDAQTASGGTAIQIKPPSITTFSSGWDVELNTIFHPYRGIDLPGSGVIPSQCCGVGTTSNGIALTRNTIISPAKEGVSLGRNHAAQSGGPGGPGITMRDNSINCETATSQTNGIGVALYEGAVWYDGTQNGPHGCHIGTLVAPGLISGNRQYAQISGDGVFGDQSGLHDLLMQPTGGVLYLTSIGGLQPWANTTGNGISVLVDCVSYPASECQNMNFANVNFHGGDGQSQPIMEVRSGPKGPFDLLITGSRFCTSGTPVAGSSGLKISVASGITGRYIITGNQIGAGCFGQQVETGIVLSIDPGSTSDGSVTIVGNDFSNVSKPIAYTPASKDRVIIANNMGIDDNLYDATLATNMVLPPNGATTYFMHGTGTINTLTGGWRGRKIRLVNPDGPVTIKTGGTVGNVCGPDLVLPAYGYGSAELQWSHNNGCWYYLQGASMQVSPVSTLSPCYAASKYQSATVSDALTPTWGAAVVGGGAVATPVFCDGTSWKVR